MTQTHPQLFLMITGKKLAVTNFDCKNDAISTNYHGEVSFTSIDTLCFSPGEKIQLIIKNKRSLHGIVTTWVNYGKKHDVYFYKIKFYSLMQKLNHINNKNYVHQTVEDIIKVLLQKNNMDSYAIDLTHPAITLKFLAQYQQSDLLLFENLLKKHGCFYVWKQKQENATLTILDDKNALATLFKGSLLSYKPFNTGIDDEDVVFEKMSSKSSQGTDYYFFRTNCCDLFPGQNFHVSTDDITYNKSFRIINIEHLGEQISDNIEAQQKSLLYQNKITCIAVSKDFLKKPKKQILLKTLTATTINQNNNTLDHQGHYFLTFSYDSNTITPAFKRTQDFNGNQIAGVHFPLKSNALVLTGFINDNINTPVILGQIPTTQQPSPVTDKNSYQYIMRTAQQSQFILDDQAKNILLENQNNTVLFHQNGIALSSHQGNVHINNAKNYSLNTGLNYIIQSKQHYQQTCQQSSFLLTRQGDILMQAKDDLAITSKQLIKIQSNKIHIQAKNTVEFLAIHQLFNIKNSLTILALELLSHLAEKIKVQATKQFSINDNFLLQANCLKINANLLEIRADEVQVYQDTKLNT